MKPDTWEVIKTANGSYQIRNKGELLRSEIPDRWLERELARYGFCGEEYRDIRQQLDNSGRAQIVLTNLNPVKTRKDR